MTRFEWLGALALAAMMAGASASGAPTPPPAEAVGPSAPKPATAYLTGYLPKGAAPNSLTLLPAPPAPGSAAQARDDAAAKAAVALSGGPRWLQATTDADLAFPGGAQALSCALGVRINPADTPRLYVLLRRTLPDIGLATYPTKNKYQRARPFTVNAAPICTPTLDGRLRKDGSYPSGHSAVGWGWALILAEVAPDRADAILARGRSFGQSRVVCNVHWLSDIEEGRTMASAVVARLHAQADFRADVEAARAEVAAARAKGLTPTRDCALEAARLAGG